MVICPVAIAKLDPVAALDGTARGGGGYGSTGV
jgi:dUTPase